MAETPRGRGGVSAMFSGGGGDEEEEASDVSAKKRAKVMAKNQAKRAQEQAWENVRQQQQARGQAMQDHRAGEKNAVAIAMNTGGGKPLAMPVPVVKQVTDKEREEAINAYRDGERNAVAIAEGYKSQVREEAKESHREGERNAMDAVREYATQSYREGEREAESIAEQARLNAVEAARWAGIKDIALEKQKAVNSSLVCVVEPEKPKTFLDRFADWIKSPSTLFGIAKEDEIVKILKNADDVPLYLPVIRGVTPYVDDLAGPLKTILMDKRTIRALGRTIGDATVPATLAIGLGLTVLPNLVTNIRDKKPWHDTVADIIIDGVGFIFSEIAGLIAGGAVLASGAASWAALPAKIGADFGFSYYWDNLAEKNSWRINLSEWLGKLNQKETE